MSDGIVGRPIRVGFYGTGRIASHTHIPILRELPEVQIAALCDLSRESLEHANAICGLGDERLFGSAGEMLEQVELDVLFSCVPGFVRTDSDVEVEAARRGVHLFCEKPQATNRSTLLRMNRGLAKAGVMTTVGFRERYRPLYQKVRDHLADKAIIHVDCTLVRRGRNTKGWHRNEDLSGGFALDWGGHAVDYTRFMTGLEVARAQAYYASIDETTESLANSINLQFASGATMHIAFVTQTGSNVAFGRRQVPIFTIYYDGGRVDIHRDGGKSWTCEIDGAPFITREEMNPWHEHDAAFIEAVRSGDENLVLNDFSDGVKSLAPILAAWDSAREGGGSIEMQAYLAGKEG